MQRTIPALAWRETYHSLLATTGTRAANIMIQNCTLLLTTGSLAAVAIASLEFRTGGLDDHGPAFPKVQWHRLLNSRQTGPSEGKAMRSWAVGWACHLMRQPNGGCESPPLFAPALPPNTVVPTHSVDATSARHAGCFRSSRANPLQCMVPERAVSGCLLHKLDRRLPPARLCTCCNFHTTVGG